MYPKKYRYGVYLDTYFSAPSLGIGLVWTRNEKYLHINVLFWELAIGKTSH